MQSSNFLRGGCSVIMQCMLAWQLILALLTATQRRSDIRVSLPRAREARTRGRVIGVSVGCLFVCLFVDTKTSSLSETGLFMSSTYYVPVRNRKILASTYLTNESVRQGAEKSRLKKFFALLKLLFNIVDPCQKNDYYQSGRS